MKGLGLLAIVLSLLASPALGATPRTMSYQGVLTDGAGTPVPNGSYNLTFKLYDVATGGTALWTESQGGISVVNGEFSVILGSLNPLNLAFDAQYWLGISVGVDPELIPRVQLASAPYSLAPQPGIAQGKADGQVNVTSTASMADLVTTTITIPAAGYIVVDASAQATFTGTSGANYFTYQIDSAAGGAVDVNQQRNVGDGAYPSAGASYLSTVAAKRAYFLSSAGAYTFRLEAQKQGGGTAYVYNPTITALYFPVCYGTAGNCP